MNRQLISKVINSDDANICPEFTYENPLVDRSVAKALARSFVKILKDSQQNSNLNNNLRLSVLTNIRKACRMQPENHLEIGETVTNLLTEVYTEELKDPNKYTRPNPVEKDLDDFLIRRLKELDVKSNYLSPVNPEVTQSLINLNEKCLKTLSKNVLNIDTTKKKSATLLRNLWAKPVCDNNEVNICDLSICKKTEIETLLLKLCYNLLTEQNVNVDDLFCEDSLNDLVCKCSMSPVCFQICCGILNCIFSCVNYSSKLQLFISEFVKNVKNVCTNTISVLYPAHLCHMVVLLNIDVDKMPVEIKESYIENTLPFLIKLHEVSVSDFVMLLSHYPQWFCVYFEQ